MRRGVTGSFEAGRKLSLREGKIGKMSDYGRK